MYFGYIWPFKNVRMINFFYLSSSLVVFLSFSFTQKPLCSCVCVVSLSVFHFMHTSHSRKECVFDASDSAVWHLIYTHHIYTYTCMIHLTADHYSLFASEWPMKLCMTNGEKYTSFMKNGPCLHFSFSCCLFEQNVCMHIIIITYIIYL